MKTNSYPIDKFKIKGVHGYKDITMNMKGKTTIFVSENGAGKTTIINALRAVIECDYFALSEMKFNEIEIKFNGKRNLITIKKDDLPEFRSIDPEPIIVSNFNLEERIFNRYSINRKDKELDFYDISSKILKFSENLDDYQSNPILQHLYLICPLMDEDFKEALKKSKEELLKNFSNITVSTFKEIREQFSDYTTMYLPTYRRVEKKLSNKEGKRIERKRSATTLKHDFNQIFYGLSDVEDMLTDMARRIERQSSLEYRSLTAAMLNDLVDMEGKDFDRNKKYDTPSKEDLERFLNRVNSNNIYATSARLMAPSVESTTLIENLRKVYRKSSNGISGYLGYFLSKLNTVIEETKETELKIESFVNICNKYLGMAGDSKNLQFNATNFKVTVKDDFANEEIALDDLSSGEKQVISLMAMLYLWDEKNKIVLIDEPELSLSLKWQQNLLPDVNDAPLVGQVVAITHSPFIFDNDLDKNSAPLKIKKHVYNGDAKDEQ